MALLSKKLSSGTASERGFTLVELLVAMSVVSMIMLMITSLVNGVSRTTDTAHRRLDADSEARMALDRIGADLERMLKRSDINYGFQKKSGDDSLAFYATTFGYDASGRPVSVLTYDSPTPGNLTRGALTLAPDTGTGSSDWKTPIFSSSPSLTSTTLPADLQSDDYQPLSENIIRFETAFLVKPSSGSGVEIKANPPSQFKDLRGIVVGIGLLDEKSRSLVTTAQLQTIANSLDEAEDDKDIASKWNAAVGMPISGVPVAVTANLKVYQRTYFFFQ